MSKPAQAELSPFSAYGLLMILLTLLGWASVPLFLKHFTGTMDAWAANGWRYGLSALIWLPVIMIGLIRRNLPGGLWRAALLPAFFNTTGQVCFAWAPYFIDAGLMSFGLRTQILFVTIGAYVLFASERVVLRSPVFIFAILTVFVGAAGTLLLGSRASASLAEAGKTVHIFGTTIEPALAGVVGVALSVVSGALFAGYALSVKRNMQGVHPVTAFATICQYTGLGMIIMMLVLARDASTGTLDSGVSVLSLPANEIVLLALSAIVGIALGHVSYYISIARLGVAISSGVIQLQPILVTLGSMYFFEERMTIPQWLFGLSAVCGAILMLAVQRRLTKPAAAATAHQDTRPSASSPGAPLSASVGTQPEPIATPASPLTSPSA